MEFKRSDVVFKRKTTDIAKEVCAFLNSTGGEIYIGVKDQEGIATELDGGIDIEEPEVWVSQAISSHIFPDPMGIDVNCERISGGFYLSIIVPRSGLAPHQCSDGRYYRRSGSRSIPMEHYEIEDIRLRSLRNTNPLFVSLKIRPLEHQEAMIYLVIENRSQSDVENLSINFSTNIKTENMKIFDEEISEGFDIIEAESKRTLLVEFASSISDHWEKGLLEFTLLYDHEREQKSKYKKFSLNSYRRTMQTPDVNDEINKKISDSLKNIERELRGINKNLREMSRSISYSGVPVFKISAESRRLEMIDHLEIMKLCDLNIDDAINVSQIFNTLHQEDKKKMFDALDDRIKAKIKLKLPDGW